MEEVERLKALLADKEAELERLRGLITLGGKQSDGVEVTPCPTSDHRLTNREIARYSRQLILPELGVQGQLALKTSSVLIVGCGGLGCPVAIYLAGAGIGRIGLLDYDVVELTNLHRQVLHTEGSCVSGRSKAASVAEACRRLNSNILCEVHNTALSSANALDIVGRYDIVVDATDNVATRYLLSDACVLSDRPLVSGGVLRFEGQLTVYHYRGSPCYRCLYPTPPSPDMVTNCSDGGVLGTVVGVIGTMQATEVIKIAAKIGSTYANKLLLYDGLDGSVRCATLRGRRKDCAVCGDSPTVTQLVDYQGFCGAPALDKSRSLELLQDSERITVEEYADIVAKGKSHFLVDVRTPVELEICKLPVTSHNIPMNEFDKVKGCARQLESLCEEVKHSADKPIIVVCRRGNDSQLAVQKLKSCLNDLPSVQIRDIIGGLHAWARKIDHDFPVY